MTEEQWIEKGMERFAQSGADGLVIEKISAELGCRRAAFIGISLCRHIEMLREQLLEI